jgi:hypothetical protein
LRHAVGLTVDTMAGDPFLARFTVTALRAVASLYSRMSTMSVKAPTSVQQTSGQPA